MVRGRVRADDRSRGQLLLVGAVTIALLIFGLAIVLNSVLYTSTVSPQAASDGTANAEMYRDSVERDLGSLMRSLADGRDYVEEDRFRSNLTAYEQRLAESVATSEAGTVSLEYRGGSSRTGGRVVQSSEADLDSGTGAEDWTVADSVTSLESFNLTIDRLPQTTPGQSREFRIRAEEVGGSDVWRLDVYYDGPSGQVVLETFDGTASTLCSFPASSRDDVTLDIDLPAGTVDGRSACSFTFAQGISGDYRLEFERIGPGGSDDTEGTYDGVIEGSIPTSNFNSPPNDPYLERTIYNATVELTYVTDSVSYETTITDVGPRPSVTAPNAAPTATFTVSDAAPSASQSVTFDASGSSDPDGSISSYQWDFDGDGSVDATGQTVSYTYGQVGDFDPQLRVIDDDGTSAVATEEVDPYGAINAGGPDMSFESYRYESDDTSPGWLSTSSGSVSDTSDSIGGLSSPNPYQSERYGNFEHAVDVEDGESYEVTLQFAEIYWEPGNVREGGSPVDDRVFDVVIEGDREIDDLDIYEEVGHDEPLRTSGYTLTYTVTVTDGELNIEYLTEADNAKVSGVIIEADD